MSIKEPGIMFDATNSWNGYNHQGKIALWYAIREIHKLIDPSKPLMTNRQELEKHFLEIEYMEDFSIGEKGQEGLRYHSVHQVKDREDSSIDAYESALLGLVNHVIDDPNISAAYLHLTKDPDLKGSPLCSHLKSMSKNPKYLIAIENEINANRQNSEYRGQFLRKKRGRPSYLKTQLLYALSQVHPTESTLTENNLDDAFNQLLYTIDQKKQKFKTITSTNKLNLINVFEYSINNNVQNYCGKDQAEVLLKQQIKDFFNKIDPNSYKTGSAFVDASYLFLLGKLDQHIVERSLNYNAYKIGQLERQILLSTIFDWLTSDDIYKQDDKFYLYHIKEQIFKSADRYCKACRKRTSEECFNCQIPVFKDNLGALKFKQLQSFLHITNPHIPGDLSMDTFGQYSSSSGITNPFLAGLRDIPQVFSQDQDKMAVTYQDTGHLQYALTAIAPWDTDDDNAIICSEIIRNRNVYSLLMDYDCLISKGIAVNSIQDEEITQSHRYDSNMSEHIAHCKNVKIVPLTTFIGNLKNVKEPIAE